MVATKYAAEAKQNVCGIAIPKYGIVISVQKNPENLAIHGVM